MFNYFNNKVETKVGNPYYFHIMCGVKTTGN